MPTDLKEILNYFYFFILLKFGLLPVVLPLFYNLIILLTY